MDLVNDEHRNRQNLLKDNKSKGQIFAMCEDGQLTMLGGAPMVGCRTLTWNTQEFIVWTGIVVIPILCVLVLKLSYHNFKFPLVEAVEKEVARIQPDKVITGRVFREPRLSSLLCALIGSTIFGLEMMELLSVNPRSRGLGWPIYAKAALVHLLLGFFSGYMAVKMMKSMKASGAWILVCFQIPCISYVFFLLYCATVGIAIRNIGISTGLLVCFSTPSILLGGYAATASNYSRLPIFLVATAADPLRGEVCWSCQDVSFFLGYLASFFGFVGFGYALVRTWENRSLTESSFMFVVVTLLLVTSIYTFLTFSHVAVICLARLTCWWWLFFLCGVPGGVSVIPFNLRSPTATSLISFIFVMVKAGTLGPLLLYFFYPLLFRKQRQVVHRASPRPVSQV